MIARKLILRMVLAMLAIGVGTTGRGATDHRCLHLQDIPLQGPADSLVVALEAAGFTPWGEADDGSMLHFRGNYYGIRCKLVVNVDETTGFVSSASIANGPYRTAELYDRNYRYFLLKLQQDYGEFTARSAAYYKVTDYGVVKIGDEITGTGSREIQIFFLPTMPFYKDAVTLGLRGNVMEVATENPVAENPVEHFDKVGRLIQSDMTDRYYNGAGYLVSATMKEATGEKSSLQFEYDDQLRLVRRTLTNESAGIRYVNDYVYDDDDEVTSQSQKVFNSQGECVLSLLLDNHYEEYDDNGNWTLNRLKVTYWEKETGTQQVETQQRRTISYYE